MVRALGLYFALGLLLLFNSTVGAEPAAPFDHADFCVAAQDIERRLNEDRGKWIDEHTRHDGMSVDCEERAIELKLFVEGAFNDLAGNWRDRTNYQWSEDYCTDAAWAAAINNQWRIVLKVYSAAGEHVSLRADCH